MSAVLAESQKLETLRTSTGELADGLEDLAAPIGDVGERLRRESGTRLQRYLALTKPRIVALITFTALVGEFLASPTLPPLSALILGTLGIALCAASSAALNQILERATDARMARTRGRPLPSGALGEREAWVFACVLGVKGLALLAIGVNVLTAVLTFATLIGYSVVYTLWLKPWTSQNIVIGGLAGAAPPVLGCAAVTGHVTLQALFLSLIIFVWTPPHFWSLAIARRDEYARAGIPMLPVTHGVEHTKWQIFLYTLLLLPCTVLPFAVGSGMIYLATVLVLDVLFIHHALRMYLDPRAADAMRTFRFSVRYLMWVFAALLLDHYLAAPLHF